VIVTTGCTEEDDDSDAAISGEKSKSMLNAGADLTLDCWLKITPLLESFFFAFDSSTGVFYLLCSLKVEWLGILNTTARCTLEELLCR